MRNIARARDATSAQCRQPCTRPAGPREAFEQHVRSLPPRGSRIRRLPHLPGWPRQGPPPRCTRSHSAGHSPAAPVRAFGGPPATPRFTVPWWLSSRRAACSMRPTIGRSTARSPCQSGRSLPPRWRCRWRVAASTVRSDLVPAAESRFGSRARRCSTTCNREDGSSAPAPAVRRSALPGPMAPRSVSALPPLRSPTTSALAALWGASPHPLFDARHVLEQRPDLGMAGVDPAPLSAEGRRRELDPHPLFSSRHYTEANLTAGQSARAFRAPRRPRGAFAASTGGHRLLLGAAARCPGAQGKRPAALSAGRPPRGPQPHPLFDTRFLSGAGRRPARPGVNPLVHYLRWGWRDGLWPNRGSTRITTSSAIRRSADVNPLLHFVQHGWREHRDPSPEFSVSGYLTANPDLPAGTSWIRCHIFSGTAAPRVAPADEARCVHRDETPLVLRVSSEKRRSRLCSA